MGMVAQERGEITLPFPVIQINNIKWFLQEGVTASGLKDPSASLGMTI